MITDEVIAQLIRGGPETPTLHFRDDLLLKTDGDRAEFVKDVLALANSGQTAHLIIGIEEETWKLKGIVTHHTTEELNEVLEDKCDPPLRVEYAERDVLHYKLGIVEIQGDNPPYLVAVPDRLGGPLSAVPQKQFFIERGTVYVRNVSKNEGARRPDLDQMYSKVDLQLSHRILERKVVNNLVEANIQFILRNTGHVSGAFARAVVQFNNIKHIVKRTGNWRDVSYLREGSPAIQLDEAIVHLDETIYCHGAVVAVSQGVAQIECSVSLYAMNMVRKKVEYVIPLERLQSL